MKIRKYDEEKISIYEVFIIETEFKWKNLIEEEFNIFFIECLYEKKLKLEFKNIEKFLYIKERNKKNRIISEKQKKDIKNIFKKIKFDVLYIIPKIDYDNFYYFNLIIITKKNIEEIKKIEEINFNLIKIKNIKEIKKENLNFNFIEKILYLNKNVINDNIIKNIKYLNLGITNKNNLIKYIEKLFCLFCIQIYSFDKILINNEWEEKLKLDFDFATNFDETKNEINNEKSNIYITTLSDNFDKINISLNSFENNVFRN